MLTSHWCRCRETEDLLGLGPVEALPALNSFFGRRERGPEQTAALRPVITGLSRARRVLSVTHQVNITALTGRAVASGELFALERRGDGAVAVTGLPLIRS